jgi:hypothetical protein
MYQVEDSSHSVTYILVSCFWA